MPSDFSVRRDRIYHIAAICEHAFCREPASTHATFQSWCTLFIRDVRNLLQAMFFEADRDPNANIVVPPFVVCLAVEDKRARGDTENPYYNPANLSMYGSRREPFGIWLVDEQYVVPHMVGWWSAYPLNPQRLRYLSQETKASAESALGSYEERTSTYHKLSFMLPLSQPSKPAAAAATHAIPPSTSSRVAGMEPTHSHSCSEPQHQVVSDDAMQLQHPSSPSSASRVPPPPTPPVIAVSTQPPTPLSSYEVRNNENRLQNGENHSNLTDLLSASSRGMELEQDPHPIGVDEPSPDSMIAANNERSSSRVPAGEANGKCDAVFRSIATRQSLPDKPTTLTESRKPSKKSFDVNTVAESHRCRKYFENGYMGCKINSTRRATGKSDRCSAWNRPCSFISPLYLANRGSPLSIDEYGAQLQAYLYTGVAKPDTSRQAFDPAMHQRHRRPAGGGADTNESYVEHPMEDSAAGPVFDSPGIPSPFLPPPAAHRASSSLAPNRPASGKQLLVSHGPATSTTQAEVPEAHVVQVPSTTVVPSESSESQVLPASVEPGSAKRLPVDGQSKDQGNDRRCPPSEREGWRK